MNSDVCNTLGQLNVNTSQLTFFTFCKGRNLSPFKQLLMTFMRLRHDFPMQDLGYWLSAHKSTISRVFNHVCNVLYVKLKPLVVWPDRDALVATMPMCF